MTRCFDGGWRNRRRGEDANRRRTNDASEPYPSGTSPLSLWERLEVRLAGCWPFGHLAGCRGPSGFSSRTTALEVIKAHRTNGVERLTGHVAVVTGGNSGVGYETARALARGGARVVLACRDVAKGEAAATAINADVAVAAAMGTSAAAAAAAVFARAGTPRVTCMELDLASLGSVRRFVDDFLREGLPLHLLVHNGGVMPCPFSLTRDGHETTFQVNFLSPFLLTKLLTQHMRDTAGHRGGQGTDMHPRTLANTEPQSTRTLQKMRDCGGPSRRSHHLRFFRGTSIQLSWRSAIGPPERRCRCG